MAMLGAPDLRLISSDESIDAGEILHLGYCQLSLWSLVVVVVLAVIDDWLAANQRTNNQPTTTHDTWIEPTQVAQLHLRSK